MPAIVSVKVISARDLPVMDRSSELTDAFVEIRMGQVMQRTDICKKTLNPVWDSPWFKFNVSDEELQEEPLTFKVMDYDQYSAHDAIGRVYLLLASIINPIQSLDGWFPIYDTLHGIRGEIHIKVLVELIKDEHVNKRSSSEVLLFSGQSIPEDYDIVSVHGFVEELLVNDDPEYQWIDKIRPPRASNESRQRTFLKLSGELQRKIGRKALDMGGNAIIGYTQSFDLEGESGIVVRGIGTCVSVSSPSHQSFPTSPFQHSESLQFPEKLNEDFDISIELLGGAVGGVGGVGGAIGGVGVSPDSSNPIRIQQIARVSSSESDGGPASPSRGGVLDNTMLLGTSAGSGGGHFMTQSEFPFYTLSSFPAGFVTGLSGIVCARSVKLLDDINEPETRDLWWNEIRTEIRSHCRSMSCNAVLGYTEATSICDDLCILSGTGTAAVVSSLVDTKMRDISRTGEDLDDTNNVTGDESAAQCRGCHVPYPASKCPFKMQLTLCSLCRSKFVPSVLLSTTEIPSNVVQLVRGECSVVQARVCKPKRRGKGEENASNVSSLMPFLEYSLHSRLLTKLKLKGMNSIFGLKLSVIVGDTSIIGIATGTGVYLEPLPSPTNFMIQSQQEGAGPSTDIMTKLSRIQEENKKRYNLEKSIIDQSALSVSSSSPTEFNDESTRDPTNIAIEMDDSLLKEEDLLEILSDFSIPEGFITSTVSLVPGCTSSMENSELITLVSRQYLDGKAQPPDHQCSVIFSRLLQSLLFRVRKLHPCIISNISFDIDLPEDDEIQITLISYVSRLSGTIIENEKQKKSTKEVFTVSPQSNLKGYQYVKHVGTINLFLIRETTSIKEQGGMGSFLQTFICEAHNLASAQVIASGGQALFNYQIRQCVILENPHKNQGQCLLNVSGSAVQFEVESQPQENEDIVSM